MTKSKPSKHRGSRRLRAVPVSHKPYAFLACQGGKTLYGIRFRAGSSPSEQNQQFHALRTPFFISGAISRTTFPFPSSALRSVFPTQARLSAEHQQSVMPRASSIARALGRAFIHAIVPSHHCICISNGRTSVYITPDARENGATWPYLFNILFFLDGVSSTRSPAAQEAGSVQL